MDWGEIAQIIYKKLRENNYGHLIDEMIEKHGLGGTPGEMFTIVCVWLAKMRNRGEIAFDLVKDEAEELFEIGYSIKYFTKDGLMRL